MEGFGDNSNYWIGLEKLHIITSERPSYLDITLRDRRGDSFYLRYDHFSVGNASSNYQLSISGYHGELYDWLSYNNGRPFSASDRDNDNYDGSCTEYLHGPWWHGSCSNVNLFGRMGDWRNKLDGVFWWGMKDTRLAYVQLKVSHS